MAAERGCFPIVKKVLEMGANPDLTDSQKNVTPLLIATKMRRLDIVKELLKYNARLDIAGLLKLQSGDGVCRMNPFRCSLLQGYPEITRLLVNCGHDLTTEKYLWTSEDLPEYLTVDVDMWLWLQDKISQPISLMESVKIFMRRTMGFRMRNSLEQVALPAVLKRYLLCVDLDVGD